MTGRPGAGCRSREKEVEEEMKGIEEGGSSSHLCHAPKGNEHGSQEVQLDGAPQRPHHRAGLCLLVAVRTRMMLMSIWAMMVVEGVSVVLHGGSG